MKSSFVGLVSTVFGFGLGTLTLLSLSTSSAQAQTYYSDLTSFNAATTGITLYDFEGIAPKDNFKTNPDVLTVAAPGRITFSVSGGAIFDVYAADATASGGQVTINGTDTVVVGQSIPGNAATTTIRLDGLYDAFAIEIGQFFNGINDCTIKLYNGDTQIGTDFATGEIPNGYFYGVTSDSAFDNIRVTANQGNFAYTLFDNARVGSAVTSSTVPEAGTLALVLPALGIVGTVLVRRKK